MVHIKNLYLCKVLVPITIVEVICKGLLTNKFPEGQALMGEEELYEYGKTWHPYNITECDLVTTSSLIVRGLMYQIAQGTLTVDRIHYVNDFNDTVMVDSFKNGQLNHKAPEGYFNVAYLAANELIQLKEE